MGEVVETSRRRGTVGLIEFTVMAIIAVSLILSAWELTSDDTGRISREAMGVMRSESRSAAIQSLSFSRLWPSAEPMGDSSAALTQ